MPTEPRDQRRAQRTENALRWSRWLKQAMSEERMEPKDIVNGSGNAINKGDVSHWMNGDYSVSVDNAILIAGIVRRTPSDALLAAGHAIPAEAMMDPREAELRATLASLEAEIDAKLEQLNALQGDGKGEENGDRGAS